MCYGNYYTNPNDCAPLQALVLLAPLAPLAPTCTLCFVCNCKGVPVEFEASKERSVPQVGLTDDGEP